MLLAACALLATACKEDGKKAAGDADSIPPARESHVADVATPKSATKEAPYVNSLGMKFVPVEITGGPTNGKRVLFSVWDTRAQDYAAYAQEKGITPEKPSFYQESTDPVVCVNWYEAKAFCKWLTARERTSGHLGARDEYRLPSDHEWSCAVGIGRQENADATPESKSGQIGQVYPWGADWPPPRRAGNYDASLQVDDFPYTSPVESFAANENGLYDMGGNVWQWCEDWYNAKEQYLALRGASWFTVGEIYLRSSYRYSVHPSDHYDIDGFRCVLEVKGG
jgi:formylglycine-generating enzyme required for sulfatase activity